MEAWFIINFINKGGQPFITASSIMNIHP